MAPEAYEALISFFVLIIITINIDPCHVPGLSLGCPEEGGPFPSASSWVFFCHVWFIVQRAQNLNLHRLEFDSAGSLANC